MKFKLYHINKLYIISKCTYPKEEINTIKLYPENDMNILNRKTDQNVLSFPIRYVGTSESLHNNQNRSFSQTRRKMLAFSSLLRENKKKSSHKMLSPLGIGPKPLITFDSKSYTILSGLTWHLLVRLRL